MANDFDDENLDDLEDNENISNPENNDEDNWTYENHDLGEDVVLYTDDYSIDEDAGEDEENEDDEDDEGQVANEIESQVENFAKNKIKDEAKKHVSKTAIKALVSNPYFWLVAGIVVGAIALIAIIIIVCLAIVAPFKNVDIEGGVFDTAKGIKGDMFYGARVVYKDDEKKSNELHSNYENLVADFLLSIDNINGIDLTINLEYTETPSYINDMIYLISKSVNNVETEITLQESLKLVDYFGYTTEDLTEMSNTLPQYIVDNSTNLLSINSETYTGNLINDLKLLFTSNYSHLNIATDAYFVEDIILEEDEMISGLTEKNYVAMMYMPKQHIELDEAGLMFYIKDGENTQNSVKVDIVRYSNGENYLIKSDTADSSWWEGDSAKKHIAIDDEEDLFNFISIDPNNLNALKDTSIYSLITNNGVNINLNNATQYFKSTADYTNDDNENFRNYISYLPIVSCNTFMYQFTGNCNFQFAEYVVEYE